MHWDIILRIDTLRSWHILTIQLRQSKSPPISSGTLLHASVRPWIRRAAYRGYIRQCTSLAVIAKTDLSLKNSYAPRRSPEYTISRIMDAVKPFARLRTPSLRAISPPIAQKVFCLPPGTGLGEYIAYWHDAQEAYSASVAVGEPEKVCQSTVRSA